MVLQPLGLLGATLVGVLAARRGIPEQPVHHRRLLAAAAGSGLGATIVGGLPKALIDAVD
ncbi:hypothetical protein B0T36_19870 [Nocardia donostiensis]|nr:hypothetical protein B0T36_19870 [Nocardia donostiensis]